MNLKCININNYVRFKLVHAVFCAMKNLFGSTLVVYTFLKPFALCIIVVDFTCGKKHVFQQCAFLYLRSQRFILSMVPQVFMLLCSSLENVVNKDKKLIKNSTYTFLYLCLYMYIECMDVYLDILTDFHVWKVVMFLFSLLCF